MLGFVLWGPKELQVREQLEGLRSRRHFFDQVRFVREHLGERGKANLRIQLKVGFLVEDRGDICKEALSKGIVVLPIRTARNDHRLSTTSLLQQKP